MTHIAATRRHRAVACASVLWLQQKLLLISGSPP
jgi:hypothetical protein